MKTIPVIIFILLTCPVFGQDTTYVPAIDSVKRADDTIDYNDSTRSIEREKFHSYPSLPKISKPLKDFIPQGWKVVDSIHSDLNADRIADLSMVLQYKDTVSEIMPGNLEWENTPRILVLLFRDKYKNEFRLALQNNYIIPRAGTGKQGGDPFDGLEIKNNIITIGGETGGEYSFRFLNGDFFLVSAWTNGRRLPKERYASDGSSNYDTFYYYKIDFLKSRAMLKEGPMDGGETEPKQKEVSLAKRPLIKLSELKEFDERKIFKGFVK